MMNSQSAAGAAVQPQSDDAQEPQDLKSPAQGTQDSVDPRDQRIQELEAQLKEKEAKHLYLYADFENFKKRAIKERSDLLKFGWEPAASELLEVIDNLERALAHMPPNSDKAMIEGIRMVLNQFRAALEKYGVAPIKTEKQVFDPNLHEAVAQEKSDAAPGTILQEHTRGYTLHGRLLRPARVTVSS